jgi:uncharacterized protein YbjT (DUF2867 family)
MFSLFVNRNRYYLCLSQEELIMKNALIAGASGLIGRELLKLLLDDSRYHQIIILVRKPLSIRHPKLIQQLVDFENLNDLSLPVAIDEAYCTLGTTIKKAGSKQAFRKVDLEYVLALGRFCGSKGIHKYLVVSAMGANPNSGIFYNRVKGEMEVQLQKIGIPGLYIFRPSLLLGKREEHRAGERMAQVIMKALGFLFIGPLKNIRGVPAEKVASSMILIANTASYNQMIIDSARILDL